MGGGGPSLKSRCEFEIKLLFNSNSDKNKLFFVFIPLIVIVTDKKREIMAF